ncbi:MAG: hypothetical protein U0237_07255 [Thermoleophilia bacterium]
MNIPRTPAAAVLAAAAALTFAACGSDGASSPAPATTATTAVSTAADATTTAATAGKVSANTASTEELVAALEANGVTNADRWAREIEEYRPYDTSDPQLTHLQDELAKYNPDPATVTAIIASLTP